MRFTENNSWLDSFYQVIPKRKQVAASGKPSNDADDVGDATESRDQVGSDSDVSLKYTGAEGTQPVIASEVSDRASSSCGYVVDKPVSNCDNSGLSLTPHCADEIQQKLDL